MNKVQEIIEYSGVEELETALVPTGFEDCCVGVEYSGEMPRLVFDAEMMVQKIAEDQGMSDEESREWFAFNLECAYHGNQTPLYIWEQG